MDFSVQQNELFMVSCVIHFSFNQAQPLLSLYIPRWVIVHKEVLIFFACLPLPCKLSLSVRLSSREKSSQKLSGLLKIVPCEIDYKGLVLSGTCLDFKVYNLDGFGIVSLSLPRMTQTPVLTFLSQWIIENCKLCFNLKMLKSSKNRFSD